mgnify:CR=1 FL=1
MMKSLSLNTVCMEANCPNAGECFKKHTATFMIMGRQCTRNCRFCNVSKGAAEPLDPNEPENVAKAVKKLGMKYVVITCVTRDDLSDGGSAHFAETVEAIRNKNPGTGIEILISDMGGADENLDRLISAKPDVINHNIETVPSLYETVRPQADYARSLYVLQYVKKNGGGIKSKTGIMVGLGEEDEEIYRVMDDVKRTGCDIFTIGQYLRPSKQHLPVLRYVTPEDFGRYEKIGLEKGIGCVVSGPLVRSSYKAFEALQILNGAAGSPMDLNEKTEEI